MVFIVLFRRVYLVKQVSTEVRLPHLLAGQILWVTPAQLGVMAGLTLPIVALWAVAGVRLGRLGFYLLFALAVTASVQLVGVYLVFASLILPALATRRQTGPRRMALALGLGAAAYALGLALSALLDAPSGAVVVLVMAALAALVAAWAARLPAAGADRQPLPASGGR